MALSLLKHTQETIKLAAPIMLGQLTHILIMISDTVMVGNFSSQALAAVALGGSIFLPFFIFGIGISIGLTPLTSAARGANDVALCREYLRHASVFYTILGFLLMFVLLFLSFNLHWFNNESSIVAQAQDYLMLVAMCVPPIMISQIFKQFMEGLGSPKESTYVNVGVTIINIALNYVFIFGKFGMPAWGAFGAGLATLIARSLGAVALVIWFFLDKKYREYYLRIFKFSAQQFIRLFKIGFPIGLQMVFESGAFAFSTIMVGWLGSISLAAHQIALNVGTATFLVTGGIAAAASIRTAYFKGLQQQADMRRAGIVAIVLGAGFMGFCGVLILLLKDFLPTLYVSEINVVELTSKLLVLVAFFQLSDGTQVVSIGALRGLEDVKIPTLITLVAYWVTGVPVGYLFGIVFEMGLQGVWYGFLSSLSVAALVLLSRFLIVSQRKPHEQP